MKAYRIKRIEDGLYSCADRYTFSHTGHLFTLSELRSHLAIRCRKYADTKFYVECYDLNSHTTLDLNLDPITIVTIKSTNE